MQPNDYFSGDSEDSGRMPNDVQEGLMQRSQSIEDNEGYEYE